LEAELRAALRREGIENGAESLVSGLSWLYPNRSLRPEFVDVLKHGYVKGADLWHLACALFLRRRVEGLLFLTLDKRQQNAATRLGF
jgi:hypothetical protein